jgi:hypothetical protein
MSSVMTLRFVAVPHVPPQVGAQLLIRLADLLELEVDLRAWGADQALCRAVATIHPKRSEGSSQA